MTKKSGIAGIIPSHVICEHEFEPCGYSMNGMEGAAYSTVHVTPEDGFSYASYEVMGLEGGSMGLSELMNRVVKCFGAREVCVAVTCKAGDEEEWPTWGGDVEGYTCGNVVKQELPGGECVVYRAYTAKGIGCAVRTVKKNKYKKMQAEEVSTFCVSSA